MFRLNKGLADGEERGLMEDRRENAQQTQRENVFREERKTLREHRSTARFNDDLTRKLGGER